MSVNRYLVIAPFLVFLSMSLFYVGARAEVVFLEGGYADTCAYAAASKAKNGRFAVTGSNLELGVMEICTRAIQGRDGAVADVAKSYNNRGVLYFERADYSSALADFDAAIAEKPLLAQAHINRGYTLAALQHWQETIIAIDRGIELGAEGLARAYFTRGVAQEELGNVRQAYLGYLRASELDPDWDEPREELTRFIIRQD